MSNVKRLTGPQYRCLVAYIMWWQGAFGKDTFTWATRELGIDIPFEDFVDYVSGSGYDWDDEKQQLVYNYTTGDEEDYEQTL